MDDAIEVEVVRDTTTALVPHQSAAVQGVPHPVKRDYHASMRYGLQMLNLWLESKGFKCNCVAQSSVSLSVEKKGFLFDIKIQRLKTANIAYITSYKGYVYDPKKINAKVVNLRDVLKGSTYVIQVVGSRHSTVPPVFIPMPEDPGEDPGVFMARSILNTLGVLGRELAKQGKVEINNDMQGVEELDFVALAAKLDALPVQPTLPWMQDTD